ncbi:MAG: DUF4123 domain-containing protein [Bdellovibrionales bacterium]|nr:DUF4123 domain-containing protein [Massilia sp.]
MIDPFDDVWLEQLTERLENMPRDTHMYLLMDGAFIPGLFRARELHDLGPVSLLFEALPSCNKQTSDVSPFLLPVKQISRSCASRLQTCRGWPMVSAIETTESCAELCDRLAAWCIIEIDDQRFNFRFPDTRRLPKIWNTLTKQQRAQFAGPASRWSYVGRDGKWEELILEGERGGIASQPSLNDAQFAALVNDSEPDEVLVQLAYRGYAPNGLPSLTHARTCMALRVADAVKLPQPMRVDWCECILKHKAALTELDALPYISTWRTAQDPLFLEE